MVNKAPRLDNLIARSSKLESMLTRFLALRPSADTSRLVASRILCGVAMEHGESARILIAKGNFTSAIGLCRLQFEALVRAMWLLYAASEKTADKLAEGLAHDGARRAERIPMLTQMLDELEGKAPDEAMRMLLEFKEYSWKPLSSWVHGGVHAIHRHSKGYPVGMLEQVMKASNAISTMVAMLLIIISGKVGKREELLQVQAEFADCLPVQKRP